MCDNNKQVLSGGPYSESGTSHDFSQTLPPSKYKFIIKDSEGDGIYSIIWIRVIFRLLGRGSCQTRRGVRDAGDGHIWNRVSINNTDIELYFAT